MVTIMIIRPSLLRLAQVASSPNAWRAHSSLKPHEKVSLRNYSYNVGEWLDCHSIPCITYPYHRYLCSVTMSNVKVILVCLVGFLTSSSTTRLYRGRAPRQERLTILRAATHETELGVHNFCLSRSHYTDTDPTCRERAATAGIEPGTSSPGVARSTAELPRPPKSDSNNHFIMLR